MKLEEFKSKISKQGLARTNRWLVRVFPPRAMSRLTDNNYNLSVDLGPFSQNINIPGLQRVEDAIDNINSLGSVGLDLDAGPLSASIDHNINLPTLGYVLNNVGSQLESLNMFTNSVNIPARDIINDSWREWGESRELGVRHQHNDLTIGYYCSENLRERLFFEQWQDLIFNPKTKRHSYYSDYISRIEVIKYNTSWSKEEAVYRFNEAYPTNIGSMEMDYQDAALLQLSIAFRFRNYERIK